MQIAAVSNFRERWDESMKESMESFYETLEVSPRASNFVIRAAYRILVQHVHPDKNQDSKEAGQRMKNINRAYAVLSDIEKRQEYDLCHGFTQGTGERRGLGSIARSQNKSLRNGAATTRPFAFRPLG
jgi:DnaJ-class molecular chaperone